MPLWTHIRKVIQNRLRLIKIACALFGMAIIFYGGWKLRDKDFQFYVVSAKAEQADKRANELIELYIKINDLQERVKNADENLQKAKNEIDNSANNVRIKYIDRMRYAPCRTTMPSTATDSGNASTRDSGRSESSPVDFGDVAQKVIKLGADRDNCAAKVTALQKACTTN